MYVYVRVFAINHLLTTGFIFYIQILTKEMNEEIKKKNEGEEKEKEHLKLNTTNNNDNKRKRRCI